MPVAARPLAYVIEDDKNLSNAFAQAIEAADFQVVVIRNGLEAIARLKEQIPSFVLIDLHIPGVGGVDLLGYLQSDQRFSRVKVIVATADNRKGEELQDQVDLVLIKPIGYQQLRDMAARLHATE